MKLLIGERRWFVGLEHPAFEWNRIRDSRISGISIQHAGWDGGQYGMAKDYSQDLRDRVIDAVELEGMSRRQAAKRFGMSASAAIKWLQRVRDTGMRTALGTGGHRRPVIDPHRDFVEAALAEKPDITLQALCDRLLAERGVASDTSMMSRFLRRAGITFKKRRLSRASRSGPISTVIADAGASTRPT
jgi:transposase